MIEMTLKDPKTFTLSVYDKPSGTRWEKKKFESLEMEVRLDIGVGAETVPRMKRFFVGEIARNCSADCIEAADM